MAEGARWLQSALGKAMGGERIAPSLYRKHLYNLQGGDSDNLDEAAVALEMVQLERGWPTNYGEMELLKWGLDKAAVRQMGEKEFPSWEYFDLTFNAKMIQRGVATALAKKNPEWQKVADSQYHYLRAYLGWAALGACWGPGRGFLPDQNKAGAGVKVATGAPIRFHCNAPFTAATGKRSWIYDGGWAQNPLPVWLSVFAWGETRKCRGGLYPNGAREACKRRGWPVDFFAPDEQAILRRCQASDVDALRWVVANIIRDYVPTEPIHLLRTTSGVSWTMLEAADAPTSTCYHCSWTPEKNWTAGTDSGGRGGEGQQIRPGKAEVDVATRRGYCVNTEGSPVNRVEFDLVPGDRVFELMSGDGKVKILYPEARPVPPTQAPSGPGRPREADHGGCFLSKLFG